MRSGLQQLGIVMATTVAIAGATIALPNSADARGGGWHHGGWGWGGFGFGLAATPYPYYDYGYYDEPYAYYGGPYVTYGYRPYYGHRRYYRDDPPGWRYQKRGIREENQNGGW
jgi:hypothetical protein